MVRMRSIFLIFLIHQFGISKPSNDIIASQDFSTGSNETYPPPSSLGLQDFIFPGFNETYHLPGHALINSHPKRFRRNTDDPLNTVIQRMKTLSSVTNAVALQIGLLADTIPHYDVIAELLHFDHVKSSDLKNPIANDVETMLNSFATLPDQFEKDVTDVLTAFDILLGIKDKIKAVQDTKSWKLEHTLQSDLESLEKDGFDLTSYEDIAKLVRCIPSQVDTLEDFKKNNIEEDSIGTFKRISICIDELISKPSKYPETINGIIKLKSGSKAVGSFSDMLTLSKTMKTCRDNEKKLNVKPESQNKLNKNFDIVSKVSEQSVKLSSYLETVLKVLAAPSTTPTYRALTYTSGFSKGFDDLKSVPLQRSDTWLESITDTTSLFKALKLLDVFIDKVKSISQELTSYRTPNPLPAATVQTFLKNPEWSAPLPGDPKTVMTTALGCTSTLPQNPSLVDLEPLNNEIAKIDTEVELIRTSMGESIGLLTNNEFVTMIKDIKEISAKAANLTEKPKLKELIEELLKYSKMTELNNVIKSFNTKFANVDTSVGNLKSLAKSVKDKIAPQNMKLFEDSWKTFEPFLSCIRGLDVTKIDAVKKLIERSQKLQSRMPVPVKREIINIVDVVTTFQTMTDLSAVISNMKSQETDETKQFSDLVDSDKLSEVIGTATRGIVNFKDLSEKKSQFDLVQSHLSLVESEISSHQGLTQPEIETPIELKKFQKIFEDLKKWRSGVKLPDPDTIPNYADIIVGGLDLTSEDINEPIKLSETVGKLQGMAKDPTVKQNLLELKTTLDELNLIGVKLSVYNDAVSKTRDALNSLNTYFVNHKKEVPTIPPTAVSSVQKSTPLSILTSTGFVEVTTVAGNLASKIPGFVVLIAAIAAIVIGGILLIGYCCCGWRLPCQKKKDKMKEHEKIPLINPPLPSKTKVTTVNETINETAEPKKKNETAEPEKKDEGKDKKDDGKNDKNEVEKNKMPEVKKTNNEEEKKETPENLENGIEGFFEDWEDEDPPENNLPIKPFKVLPESEERILRDLQAILKELQRKEKKYHAEIPLESLLHYFAYVLRLVKQKECVPMPFLMFLNETRRGSVAFGLEKAKIWLHLDSISKVQQKNGFINGVCYTFPNKAKWYLCETPIVPRIEGDLRTDDKFALFAAQVQAGAVVFLCDSSEVKSKSEPTYGEYFPRLVDKPIEIPLGPNGQKLVMTLVRTMNMWNGLDRRRIHIKFKDQNAPRATLQKELDPEARKEMEKYEHSNKDFNPNDIDHTFVHYQFNQWKADSAPNASYIEAFKILFLELEDQANVIVHCSDGIERCGALAFIESLRQKSNASIQYRSHYSSIRATRPGALEVNVQSAFGIMVLAEIANDSYKNTPLDDNAKRLHAKRKPQHPDVPGIRIRLSQMYNYALSHQKEKDSVKDEIKPTEEQKKIGDAPKETKKPAETVDVPKHANKPDETRIEVERTQDSDPLLGKPSLKEDKTQEDSK